jgi:hypothetical protein
VVCAEAGAAVQISDEQMKKLIVTLILLIVLAAALGVVFIQPVAIAVTKNSIENALPGAKVTIAKCSIHPEKSVSFSGIRIFRSGAFDIEIKDLGMEYDLRSLARGSVRKTYIKGASINVNSNSKDLGSLFHGKVSGSVQPGIFVEEIELSGVSFHITIDGSNASGSLDLIFENMELSPKKFGLNIDSALVGPVRLKGLRFAAARGMGDGIFGIDVIKVNDINVTGISGQPLLSDKKLVIDKLTARVFNGNAEGVFSLALDKEANFSLDMKVSGIDTHEAVIGLKLGEKVDSTGSIKGELKVEGKGSVLTVIKGVFSVDENGGLFVIKDEEFLKMIAERTKQPIEIIRESFRDYRYSKGTAWLNLEEKDLHSGIALEGVKGKRNVDLVFHDIIN